MSIADPTDEELRELFFLFSENRPADPRMPPLGEISLTLDQLREVTSLLGNRKTTNNEAYLQKELADAGRYFTQDLYFQESVSPSKREARFKAIQNAALDLLDALGVTSASPSTIPHEISAFLQIAATEYGRRIGRPKNLKPYDTHWNFWEACKLPSVITSIGLLEHWAGMASQMQRRSIGKGKRNSGDTAFCVLIHRLALVWLHTTGTQPGAGYSIRLGHADGPFIRFANQYLASMRDNVTAEHLRYVPTLTEELTRNKDSIALQLKSFKVRLAAAKP